MIRLCTCSGESTPALKLSKKRLAAASCKICGGNLLVDGTGSLSGNMLSTVGLEVTSVINPDLTWKTVSKGNRSASRRARKPIARGLEESGDPINKDPKRVDMSVSESEKLGVTVLGRRFTDKIEHVPIKKRRFLFRSPSPPPRMPSPHLEGPESSIKSQPASDHDSSPNSIVKQNIMATETDVANELGQVASDEIVVHKNSKEIREKLDDNEDFSGISILAAVACNNSIEVGAGIVEGGSAAEESFEVLVNTESCSMAKESFKEQNSLNCTEISNHGTDSCMEETSVSLETTNSSPRKQAMVSDVLECPCSDTSVALSDNLPSDKDGGTLKRLESSLRDDRSHWDLNIVMDAWDNPCEDPIINSPTIAVNGISEDCLHSGKPENLTDSVQPRDALVDVCEDVCRVQDMGSLVPETDKSNREERNLDASETISSHQVVGEGACIDNSCSGAEEITIEPMHEECIHKISPVHTTEQTGDGYDADAQSEETICLEGSQVENPDVVVPDVAISKKASDDDELSMLGASVGEDGRVVVETKVHDGNVFLPDDKHLNTIELESSGQIKTEVFTPKAPRQTPGVVDTPTTIDGLSSHEVCKSHVDDHVNSSGRIALEGDPSKDNDYDSGDSHKVSQHLFEAEKNSELEAGYDSQYEDGELREAVEHYWEEDVGDEGETEQVDYGSDNRDAYDFEAATENPMSIAVQVEGLNVRKERSPEDQVKERSKQEDNCQPCVGSSLKTIQSTSSRMKLCGLDKFPEGCKSLANMTREESNKRNSMPMVARRELPSSCIVRPTSSDVLLRKDISCIQGTRSYNFDDSNPRFERDTGSVKPIGRGGSSLHSNGRGRGGALWLDSSGRHWGQNRRHSPSYRNSVDFVHPGQKTAAKLESSGFFIAADGTIVKGDSVGPSGRIRRLSVNGSEESTRRSLTRRGSPADRDEAFGMHVRLGPVRERSSDRSINVGRGGRSGRYGPQMFGRVPRERYHGSVADDCYGSPIRRRGAPHLSQSHTRSRSRSRTRSPHICSSPRRRNSPPNSRPEDRMGRLRSPHRRPGFGSADHMLSFSSTNRLHGSPPHSSRWIDGRKDAAKHIREHGYKPRSSVSERSPPRRLYGRNHRLDLVDSRPDEYYKPPVHHPGRFPEMFGAAAAADRGPRCDGSDDDKRKRSDKYGMVHSVRHYGIDGTVKRFRYDPEDDFAAQNSRSNKDTCSGFHGSSRGGGLKDFVGDAPRRAREDKGHFRYGREGKYDTANNNNSKSFGMRECDEDMPQRRRRPS